MQRALVELAQSRLVDSAHDCSDGGLVVALAECGFGRGVGMRVELRSQELPAEFVLFGEDASRVVVSCDQSKVAGIQEIAGTFGLSADVIGETVSGQLEIKLDGRVVILAPVVELRDGYEGALERALRTELEVVAAD